MSFYRLRVDRSRAGGRTSSASADVTATGVHLLQQCMSDVAAHFHAADPRQEGVISAEAFRRIMLSRGGRPQQVAELLTQFGFHVATPAGKGESVVVDYVELLEYLQAVVIETSCGDCRQTNPPLPSRGEERRGATPEEDSREMYGRRAPIAWSWCASASEEEEDRESSDAIRLAKVTEENTVRHTTPSEHGPSFYSSSMSHPLTASSLSPRSPFSYLRQTHSASSSPSPHTAERDTSSSSRPAIAARRRALSAGASAMLPSTSWESCSPPSSLHDTMLGMARRLSVSPSPTTRPVVDCRHREAWHEMARGGRVSHVRPLSGSTRSQDATEEELCLVPSSSSSSSSWGTDQLAATVIPWNHEPQKETEGELDMGVQQHNDVINEKPETRCTRRHPFSAPLAVKSAETQGDATWGASRDVRDSSVTRRSASSPPRAASGEGDGAAPLLSLRTVFRRLVERSRQACGEDVSCVSTSALHAALQTAGVPLSLLEIDAVAESLGLETPPRAGVSSAEGRRGKWLSLVDFCLVVSRLRPHVIQMVRSPHVWERAVAARGKPHSTFPTTVRSPSQHIAADLSHTTTINSAGISSEGTPRLSTKEADEDDDIEEMTRPPVSLEGDMSHSCHSPEATTPITHVSRHSEGLPSSTPAATASHPISSSSTPQSGLRRRPLQHPIAVEDITLSPATRESSNDIGTISASSNSGSRRSTRRSGSPSHSQCHSHSLRHGAMRSYHRAWVEPFHDLSPSPSSSPIRHGVPHSILDNETAKTRADWPEQPSSTEERDGECSEVPLSALGLTEKAHTLPPQLPPSLVRRTLPAHPTVPPLDVPAPAPPREWSPVPRSPTVEGLRVKRGRWGRCPASSGWESASSASEATSSPSPLAPSVLFPRSGESTHLTVTPTSFSTSLPSTSISPHIGIAEISSGRASARGGAVPSSISANRASPGAISPPLIPRRGKRFTSRRSPPDVSLSQSRSGGPLRADDDDDDSDAETEGKNNNKNNNNEEEEEEPLAALSFTLLKSQSPEPLSQTAAIPSEEDSSAVGACPSVPPPTDDGPYHGTGLFLLQPFDASHAPPPRSPSPLPQQRESERGVFRAYPSLSPASTSISSAPSSLPLPRHILSKVSSCLTQLLQGCVKEDEEATDHIPIAIFIKILRQVCPSLEERELEAMIASAASLSESSFPLSPPEEERQRLQDMTHIPYVRLVGDWIIYDSYARITAASRSQSRGTSAETWSAGASPSSFLCRSPANVSMPIPALSKEEDDAEECGNGVCRETAMFSKLEVIGDGSKAPSPSACRTVTRSSSPIRPLPEESSHVVSDSTSHNRLSPPATSLRQESWPVPASREGAERQDLELLSAKLRRLLREVLQAVCRTPDGRATGSDRRAVFTAAFSSPLSWWHSTSSPPTATLKEVGAGVDRGLVLLSEEALRSGLHRLFLQATGRPVPPWVWTQCLEVTRITPPRREGGDGGCENTTTTWCDLTPLLTILEEETLGMERGAVHRASQLNF